MDTILYINKPSGYTSFDVCNKLRRTLNTKKIGHTGTLDPNATGVLIVLVGKYAKLNQFLTTSDKIYTAQVKLGFLTDTKDIWGNVIAKKEIINFDYDKINNVLKSFIGKQKQIPPMTSAIKINGKKLMQYQKEGIEVEIPAREIEVFSLDLVNLNLNENTFTVKCHVSKGTYIRSLVEDICLKLNNYGSMSNLVREECNGVKLTECQSLDDIINGKINFHDPLKMLEKYYYIHQTTDPDHIKQGKRIRVNSNDEIIIVKDGIKVLAAYEKCDEYTYKSKRGLF